MSADRDALASRTLPFMTLSDAKKEHSLTAPPPPLPKSLSGVERAAARFAVEGNVVITGGAGTLGLSTARALLEHGASGLCLWDLESTLRTSQSKIVALAEDFPNARVFGVSVNVTDTESIAEGVQSVVQTLGSLDHIFCFAGIVACFHALEMNEKQWRQTLEVNTTGAFLCAQAAAKQMASQAQKSKVVTTNGDHETNGVTPTARGRGGHSITLTASISAHRVNFPQPQVAYNVSKAGIIALKSSLAAEWAVHGIRVNSISPGYMDTILNAGDGSIKEARDSWASRNPMGRMGSVGELDGVCVLLASGAGSYINGADFVVDGGACCF
ncbi:hypothetical protein LTR37_005827 [Vermiconidia calcicola]|uniref:Uncharacterized protein n=1 Tax=Vermiconidia calcicola TaxID=1690605 RepID=A0ACC3NIU3_9PEZI|nr:hypothetical protein LTR37_005827 [Vermiconidia calcicola]